jgi:hypothetical protein
MSKRALLILLAAVAVLILLAVFGQRGDDMPGSIQGTALVPELQAALNDVERVAVVKGGGETVATLERRADTWVVAEKNGYRADVAKIRESLIALAEARVLEQKTANPQLHGRLGVEDIETDTAAGIAISVTAGARELPTVILGDAEGPKYRYARRAGEAQSYLIDRDPDVPRNSSQWVESTIIDLRAPRVQQVTITHPDGEVVAISKSDPAATAFEVANVPAERELLYAGVANVIGSALRELNLEDVEPIGADELAEQAQQEVVVEYRTFDGLVITARGLERNDASWVRFDAAFDPEQAALFAAETAAGPEASGEDPSSIEPDGEAGNPAGDADDPAAEAQRVNERVAGWRYRIAGYQYDQMTRRMTDLLQPAG